MSGKRWTVFYDGYHAKRLSVVGKPYRKRGKQFTNKFRILVEKRWNLVVNLYTSGGEEITFIF
jgi:hypothetical protein